MTTNHIDSTVTDNDIIDAKRKRKAPATYAEELLETLKLAVPYGTTFIEEIPHEHRKAVEQMLKSSFENWANSWIAPQLREIIAKTMPFPG